MRNVLKRAAYAAVFAAATSCSQGKSVPKDGSTPVIFDLLETPVGDVDFPVSCNPKAAKLVERGVALLHHMMYAESSFVFNMAADADSDCAMARWGQAMTIISPLWPKTPSEGQLRRGEKLVNASLAIGGKSAREQSYLTTTAAYFQDATIRSETERLAHFDGAWQAVSMAHAEDTDAKMFSVLASLATLTSQDNPLERRKQLGREAEQTLSVFPQHPGAGHYLIHAYDHPALAPRAEKIADSYGAITPRVPHATHMVSHIYVRLGLWDDVIAWNDASAQSAWGLCISTGTINDHYTHALDYLAYAHLQKGDDAAVLDILNILEALETPYQGNLHASAYALAAIPARFALERQDWAQAAKLSPRTPEGFSWSEEHAPYISITHFARALGLARLGDPKAIDDEIAAMVMLKDQLTDPSGYWSKQIDIQNRTAEAWQLHATGDYAKAIKMMKAAAEMEEQTEKHPITPSAVLPATDLLGAMLMEQGDPDQAYLAYERSVSRSPNRLNSLYGLARAAQQSGNGKAALQHYRQIIEMAGHREGSRIRLDEALRELRETR